MNRYQNIPVIKSFTGLATAEIRNPNAVRPWQHVLDCLSGYLQLVDSITQRGLRGAWNFGPDRESCKSVGEVVGLVAEIWGSPAKWEHAPDENAPHEDSFLFLDSSKAQKDLRWENKLSLSEAVRATIDWEKQVIQGESALEVSQRAVRGYLGLPN
jgi:CDP-glucose 4,6-dehydratase